MNFNLNTVYIEIERPRLAEAAISVDYPQKQA